MIIYDGFGLVERYDSMGDWRDIVKIARVSHMSLSKDIDEDLKLLRNLLKWSHLSPFEHCQIIFRIDGIPLYSAEQFLRYRTAKVTKRSYRYVNLLELFNRISIGLGEDSDYAIELLFHIPRDIKNNPDAKKEYLNHIRVSIAKYKYLVEQGIDEEKARGVLPTSLRTEMYYTIDMRNLFHIFSERISPHTQPETREVAKAMFVEAYKYDPVIIENWVEQYGSDYIKSFFDYVLKQDLGKDDDFNLQE